MTDDRHPGLQALFDAARPPDANSMLVEKVMAKIEQDRRRTMLGWIVAGVVLIPIAWWLSAPVVQIVGLAAQLMPSSLIEVETTWLAQITAPINSVSFVVGMTFLVAWRFFWKLRH
ncbi:MAG: hypothetical protein QNJ23_11335 [Woeseiaceae bacterium]|nr:hypothetical protein [Woeseiaceae bacterium]